MYTIAHLLMGLSAAARRDVRWNVGVADGAFALLEECCQSCDESLVWLKAESLRPDSPWEGLRADPRFTELLQRLGLGR
jgi:hypothetical protein